ncbi:MAG: hypothetical protein Q8Q41_05180 [bacterium]|nr:hypothetical protein [bacterium]
MEEKREQPKFSKQHKKVARSQGAFARETGEIGRCRQQYAYQNGIGRKPKPDIKLAQKGCESLSHER